MSSTSPTNDRYIAKLRADDEEKFQQMLTQSLSTEWGTEPATQPIHRCVAHVCSIITSKVEEMGGGKATITSDGGLEVGSQLANKFAKRVFPPAH